jgi:hypothetical protein
MKKTLSLPFMVTLLFSFASLAQEQTLPQNFLFDDSDIIISVEDSSQKANNKADETEIEDAVSSARKLLKQKPTKLRQQNFPTFKSRNIASSQNLTEAKDAPFGLLWGSSIADTRRQGVQLSVVEMKDYLNSFLATRLPKPINFFERIYVVYGKEDKLYRILAYSRLLDDDASASKALSAYQNYSDLLNKKYGHQEDDITLATVTKMIKNAQGREEEVEEQAPIGNPNFLQQLESGEAVIFSTYYNDEVAAALSIGVDGDKKSYIVVDYKNLKILEEQEAKTLDAL